MEFDRRRLPRYAFRASAELVHSEGRTRAEVTDITTCGCHLVASEPLSIGMKVQVKIRKDSDCFEAPAMVVHSKSVHAGLWFHNIEPSFWLVLQRWVTAARSAAGTVVR